MVVTYTWEEAGRRVLEDLDLSVLSDLYPEPGCSECNAEDNAHMGHPGFYIGWPQELGAGLRGGSVETPNFKTAKEALEWAGHNEETLRKEVVHEC